MASTNLVSPAALAPAPAPASAPTPSTTPTISFGIILDVNGTQVPIDTGSIGNALKGGVDFQLQQPVDLGSINDFMKWAHDEWGVPVLDPNALPAPLNTVVGDMTGMDVTIEKLHVHVPAPDDKTGVKYTFLANGTLAQPVQLIDGKLAIDGFVFGFSNEDNGS
jgi:hypothetical protein